jgi:hypothetical protein
VVDSFASTYAEIISFPKHMGHRLTLEPATSVTSPVETPGLFVPREGFAIELLSAVPVSGRAGHLCCFSWLQSHPSLFAKLPMIYRQ